MRDRKLIRLLQKLSAWEMRHFVDFVHSPYHNKHPRLQQLVLVLHKQYPDFEAGSLAAESLFEEIFGPEPFRMQALTDLFSYLSRMLEDFLALRQYEQDASRRAFYLIRALGEKEAQQEYLRYLEQGQASLAPHDYYAHYLLNSEQVAFLARSQNRVPDAPIEATARQLDLFYLEQSLRFACERLNRQAVVSQVFDLSLPELLAGYLKERLSHFQSHPTILVYYSLFQMLADPENENAFHKALALLQVQHQKLPPDQLPDMFGYLLNSSIRRINAGAVQFRPILLNLYQWLLEQDLLLEKGWLSPFNFKNIVSLGLQLHQHDWVETFIRDFSFRIEPSFRENARTYNLAMLRYEQGKLQEALRLLRDVEFDDVFYQLGAKTLLLKAYYQTGSYEPLLSLLDALAVYLKRNRDLSPLQVERYRSLLGFARKLLRLRLRSLYQDISPANIEALKKKVKSHGNVSQRDWLLDQIGQLGKPGED